NDGAAAVIVMSDTKARELGITPLARIVASGVSGLNPEIIGLGPIEASRQALKRAGMTLDDIDLVEINEAFAAQVIPSARHLAVPLAKLHVQGGPTALGRPCGMTGARLAPPRTHALQDKDKTRGRETMCVGGGQGMAMIFERLSGRRATAARPDPPSRAGPRGRPVARPGSARRASGAPPATGRSGGQPGRRRSATRRRRSSRCRSSSDRTVRSTSSAGTSTTWGMPTTTQPAAL